MSTQPTGEQETYSAEQIAAAVRATYGAFVGAGFAFASWAARIPQVRDRLDLTPAGLGVVLLAIAAGSVLALPMSAVIVSRLNARRTVTTMALLLAGALTVIAFGYRVGVAPVVIGLFLFGFAIGAWDVAMNVHGADAERHLGRAIMPRFHAGYSLGTVAGALVGAATVALKISVTVHFIVVAVVIGALVPAMCRGFLPEAPELADAHVAPVGPAGEDVITSSGERSDAAEPGVLARWREPRTLLIGLFVLAFAFTEGTGNDWISVALIDGYHASAAIGTLGFAFFLAAMTAARWVGPGLLDRYGRVTVVRTLAIIAVVGLLLFVFSPNVPLAFVGAVLWGAGASLGFPVGMSAAADDPGAAAGRVSVVASIGYCAFLGGPPLIGVLGLHEGTLRALTAVPVLLGVAILAAGALPPPRTPRPSRSVR